jgi:hypothetical protein
MHPQSWEAIPKVVNLQIPHHWLMES